MVIISLRNGSIAVAAVVLAVFLYFQLQGEEARVQKQFSRLSGWAIRNPEDQTLALAGRSNKIRSFFASSVSLHVGEDMIAGHYSNEDIRNLALNTLTYFTTVSLSFEDLDIRIIAPDEARAQFFVRFTAQDPEGMHIDEHRALASVLRNVEGDWLFESFDLAAIVDDHLTQ